LALIALENAGQAGIVQDIQPWQLPPGVWSDGNNVRMENGSVQKCRGYSSVMETCPVVPYHVAYLKDAANNKYWVMCGLTAVHVYDVGASSWSDITRASGAYSATAGEGWTSTVIGGVIVINNFIDVPQFWAISSSTGLPSTSTKLADLTAWVTTDRCKSMRSFRSFLVAMNIEDKASGTLRQARLIKWSTEAAIQAVPSSWDETNAALDAGEYELADTKGAILDGLPLRDTFMIYKEDAVYSMTYVGTPFIFGFRQLSPSVGLLSKNCVAEFDGGHFIFGNGDLYLNDGQRITSLLPHKMRDRVFSTMDGDFLDKSFVVADYGRNEMLACFVSADSTNNQCDKALIWNWVSNTFAIRDLPGLSHMGYGSVKNEAALTTWAAPTTTLSAAITSTTATTAISVTSAATLLASGTVTIDSEQISYTAKSSTTITGITRGVNSTTAATHLLSAAVVGGAKWDTVTGPWATSWENVENVLLFASAKNTKLYRDNVGNKEDILDMTSFVERTGLTMTSANQPDQTTVKRIKAVWPKMTITNSDTVNFYVGTQMSTEDGISWKGPFPFNPDSQSKVSCRAAGKLYGVKIESTSDMDWRLDGLEFELDDAGRRGSRNY
jgi:hypothetical protein